MALEIVVLPSVELKETWVDAERGPEICRLPPVADIKTSAVLEVTVAPSVTVRSPWLELKKTVVDAERALETVKLPAFENKVR